MSKSPKLSPWALAAGALAVLGGSAYYVHRKGLQAEAHNPPNGRFIKVDGVSLHYTEHGDPHAPPLVMLHGLGSMGAELALSGLVDLAARQFRVLVFDRPGYGHSDRPAGRIYTPHLQARLVLEALSQLGVERPVVLAHSWATLVAVSMAQQAPEALKGLVLLGGFYTPSLRLDMLLASMPAIPVVGRLMAHTVSPLVSRALWPVLMWRIFSPAPKAVREAFDRRYPKWMTLRPQTLRAAAAESAMLLPQTFQLGLQASALPLPVVFVAGEKDRLLMSYWHSIRAEKHASNSRLRLVPNAGHMVHHAAPEEVLNAVRDVSSMVNMQVPLAFEEPVLGMPEDMPPEQHQHELTPSQTAY